MLDEVILKVLDVFEIEGSGTVVTGNMGDGWKTARVGDKIELRRPDGFRVATSIKDMEHFQRGRLTHEPIPSCGLLLADIFSSDQLPPGTEVLKVDIG